jgi:CheY-like chemotaxis protein/anti-sigma regulatory factor (Ser/Thr protein kinase)
MVLADQHAVQQIIVNLVQNAIHAPRGSETARRRITINAHALPDGLVVSVRDNGPGIPEEYRTRIFEPFFTTKGVGKGTGLGLSTVYGIVHQNGGHITVESAPGTGTTFRIYLPLHDAPAAEPSVQLIANEERGGSETILLVEDEDSVRAVARESLRRHGYAVLEATNAEAALAVSGDFEGEIELLLTDVVMPGLSGRALADRLASARPGTKVLYMSGYTDAAIVQHGVLEPGLNYLQKPFTPDILAHKVRQVLDQPARK